MGRLSPSETLKQLVLISKSPQATRRVRYGSARCLTAEKMRRFRSLAKVEEAREVEETYDDDVLKKVRVRFFGDSLTWQAAMAVGCYVSPDLEVDVSMRPLHTVPINETTLRAYLFKETREVDVAVISLGSWYDVEGAGTEVDAGYLANVLLMSPSKNNSCSAETARRIRQVETEATPQFAYHASNHRRECRTEKGNNNPLLDARAYSSDLLRLAAALRSIDELPLLLWKEVPPQHFAMAKSGVYHTDHAARNETCGPIRDRTKARQRNLIADRSLLNSVTFAGVVRTFDSEYDHWDQHMELGDCTHFCLPSLVTWHWATHLLATLQAALLVKRNNDT